MKGITDIVKLYIENRKIVNINNVCDFSMNSGEVDESGVDFKREAYKASCISSLNMLDYYSTGNGRYAHISAMSAAELTRVSDRLKKTAESLRNTANRLDGQLFMTMNGDIHIPEPTEIYNEKAIR